MSMASKQIAAAWALVKAATEVPWHVAGVRVKLDRQDTHAICKYDESALTVTPALDLAKVQALVDAVQAYIDRSEDYQIIATDRGGTRGPKGKAFIAVGDAYADLRAALAAMKDGK